MCWAPVFAFDQVLLDPPDHLILVIDEIHVGGGRQVRMTKDRLHITHA